MCVHSGWLAPVCRDEIVLCYVWEPCYLIIDLLKAYYLRYVQDIVRIYLLLQRVQYMTQFPL